jgi:ethanolamine utilization protein EutN
MRIAEVIGKVTLSQCHPSLDGASWRLGVVLNQDGIQGDENGREEPIVIFDELAATTGSRIALSDGAEAAAPFLPKLVPIDAYNAAILDHVELEK